jgi:hypothetical protein
MTKKKFTPGGQPPSEIKFKYQVPDQYTPLYTNAVWGGINVKGEIEMHFAYDRKPLPQTTTHKLKDGALLGKPEKFTGDDTTLRVVQTGVVMNQVTAQSLYEWLGEKLILFKEIENERIESTKKE